MALLAFFCTVSLVQADLVALYRFEGSTTADVAGKLGSLSGNTYNGTAVGDAVTLSSDVSGVNGGSKSLSLGGSGDYITLPINAVNPFDGSQSYTITCWFKHPALGGSSPVILSSARDNTIGNHSMAFFLENGTGGNLRTDNFFIYENDIGTGLGDDAWHFGVVTYEPGTGFRLRVDDSYSSIRDFDPSIPSIASDTVIIGGTLNTDFPFPGDWAGLLDDVAIFNHKLTDAELDAVKVGNFSAYVVSSPEIDVLGNGMSIANGDTTPRVADYTDFGGTAANGGMIIRTFTITNAGNAVLNLTGTPKIQLSGVDASQFLVLPLSGSASGELTVVNSGFEIPNTIPGGWAYQGSYDFNSEPGMGWVFGISAGVAGNGSPWFINPAVEGTQAAFIQNDGPDASFSQDINFPTTGDYLIRFKIVRRGGGYEGNDIDVQVDGASVGTVMNTSQTSDTWTEFSFTYTCSSTGNHTVAFVGTRGGGDYDSAIDDVHIDSGLGTIAPGVAETFRIQFTPNSTGVKTATVTIVNDDSDEGSYTFDIQGTGTAAGTQNWTADTGNGNGTGNTTADSLRIRLNGANIEFSADGGTSWSASVPYATSTTLTLTGSGADDTFVIDFSGGNPIPSGGVTIIGAGQVSAGDAIILTGGNYTTVTYSFLNKHDGSIDIDGSLISYTGLEPIIDNSDAVNRIFDFTGGAETITVMGVSGTLTKVDSTLGEAVTFNNPTGSLTINAGTGDDIISLDSLSSGWGAVVTVTLNGDDGDDQFGLGKTVATAAPIIINGGAHTTGDTLTFGQEGDAGISSSGASPGTISGGTPAIQTVNYDTVETVVMISTGIFSENLIVADRGPYFSTGTILLIDTNMPVTQTVLSTTLKDPYDIDLDASGNIVVADYENGGNTSGIYKINKTTLSQTTVSKAGSFVVPFGVKVDKSAGVNSGKYIVADLDADNDGANKWGAVFVVNPAVASPGNQTKLSSRSAGTGTDFYWLTGLTIGSAGDIYVCDQGSQSNPGGHPPRIFHVDPATGNRTVITSAGNLIQPIGIVVISGTGPTATLAVVDGLLKRVVIITAGVQSVVTQTGVTFSYPTHIALDGLDFIVTDAPPGAVAGQRRVHRVVNGVSGGSPAAAVITADGFLEQPRGTIVVP